MTEEAKTKTETEAVVDLTKEIDELAVQPLLPDVRLYEKGIGRVIDPERYGEHPQQKRGSFEFDDVDSLVGYAIRHHTVSTVAFLSQANMHFRVIFDAHAPIAVTRPRPDAAEPPEASPLAATGALATAGDALAPPPTLRAKVPNPAQVDPADANWHLHTATCTLTPTVEWQGWIGLQRAKNQIEFAEQLEDLLDTIVKPDATDVMEMVKTFETHTGGGFKGAVRMDNGDISMSFVQQTEARAGTAGNIVIPKEFELELRPFEGCRRLFKVRALFRYRQREGVLSMFVKLYRPDLIVKAALADEAMKLAEVGIPCFNGTGLKGDIRREVMARVDRHHD